MRMLHRSTDDERGMVMVFFAIVLLVLLAFAGLVVDVGHWYLSHQRMQNAADAAALAGAPYLPEHPDEAIAVAKQVMQKNHQDPSSATYRPNAVNPSIMQVDVVQNVHNYFASVIGIATTRLRVQALATWRPPLQLGSPSNILGNGPSTPGHPTYSNSCNSASCSPNIWVATAGGATLATNGDKFDAAKCGPQSNTWTASQNCKNGSNQPYNGAGETYTIKVDPGATGPLTIDLYDPVFVNTGDRCDSQLVAVNAAQHPDQSNYAVNPSPSIGPYCTGDYTPINDTFTGTEMATTFSLTASAGLGGVSTPVNGCAETFGGYEFPWSYSSAHPWNGDWHSIAQDNFLSRDGYRAYSDNGYVNWSFASERNDIPKRYPAVASPDELAQMLVPGTAVSTEINGPVSESARMARAAQLRTGYRQWVSLCTINPHEGMQYQLHVSAPRGAAGINRFSIDAHFADDYEASKVHVFAQDNLVVYTQANTAKAQFYLARIPSSAAGETARVALWDFGDAGNINPAPSIGIQVRAGCAYHCSQGSPIAAPALGTGSQRCTYSKPLPTSRVFADASARIDAEQFNDTTDCGFHVQGSSSSNGGTYDGRDVDITVPIPRNWSCDDADPRACWLMLSLDYGNAGYINDTSTWQVSMEAAPIHLVNRVN